MKINRTVERSIKILELLSKEKKGLSIKQIVDKMQIPKTSAYDILETLAYYGMLDKSFDENKLYRIGLKSYQVGNSYTQEKEIFNIIRKPLQDLADKVNKTVFYAIEKSGKIVYMSKYEPEKAIITTAGVGSTNPMYCTSLGKAMLAFYNKDKQNEIIKMQSFEKKTPFSLSEEELKSEIEIIKNRGYSIDNREVEEHMLCIGAPIYNYSKEVVGAISISGLYQENNNLDRESKELMKISFEISKKLGF